MIRKLMICALVVCVAASAWANVPDRTESYATSANGTTLMSLFCLPSGAGKSFTEAFINGGTGPNYDCTITLVVNNAAGDPIANWPFEDLWLETTGGGMMLPCPAGTTADFNTDADGITSWNAALLCAGSSEGEDMQVMISGLPLEHPGMPIVVNSADMNGDGAVALGDVALFAGIYLDPLNNDYSADFFWDSAVNISDLVLFAQGYGGSCP